MPPGQTSVSTAAELVAAVGNSAYNSIIVASGTYHLDAQLTFIARTVSIRATEGATLDAGGSTPERRVLEISSGSNVELEGLVIQGGWAMKGGGIFNSGSLAMKSCTVTSNMARNPTYNGYSNEGGGIYNSESGSLSMMSCIVTLNTAYWGGGIYNCGTIYFPGDLAENFVIANTVSNGDANIYNCGSGSILDMQPSPPPPSSPPP